MANGQQAWQTRPAIRQGTLGCPGVPRCAIGGGGYPLPLTSRTYVRFREIRRDDRYRVCDLLGVPVLPLERCPAGGPGGPVPVGWLSEDLADEQGDGSVSAGGALAAGRAAGIGGDVAADQ